MEYLDNTNAINTSTEAQSKKNNNISNYLEFSLANESSNRLIDEKSSKFKLPIIKSPR
jgi:hypothetical protein